MPPLHSPFYFVVVFVCLFVCVLLFLLLPQGGRIIAGCVTPGDRVLVSPLRELATVKGIHVLGAPAKIAGAGDNCELGLTIADPNQLQIGQTLCSPDIPIPLVTCFEAQIITLQIRFVGLLACLFPFLLVLFSCLLLSLFVYVQTEFLY